MLETKNILAIFKKLNNYFICFLKVKTGRV